MSAYNYGYRPPRRRVPWLLVVGLVFAVAMVFVLLFVILNGGWYAAGYHPVFGVFGGLLLVFLLLWIGFFVVRMVFWSRAWGRRGNAYGRPDPAVMMARRRYARGEITREQYDQIMTDLERRRPQP